ncbi:gas vesicle protein [Planotetraspora thailandica]|uniref:gas vesicle protein n=1 Tax=Planotetraspora thailandica TaxID=487172 RepID=UPI0035715AD4
MAAEGRLPAERVALVDLLDRLLAGGVVVTGDLVISIADIDLVRISLRALIASVRTAGPPATSPSEPSPWEPGPWESGP